MIRQIFICDCGCKREIDLDDEKTAQERTAIDTLRLQNALGDRFEFYDLNCLLKFLGNYIQLSKRVRTEKDDVNAVLPGLN